MKKTLFVVSLLVVASLILGACAAPATTPTAAPQAPKATDVPKPAAPAGKPLFVVINKSADQQYFIDLQNSFVSAANTGIYVRGTTDINRWRDDALRDAHGSFLYLRWTPSQAPVSLTLHPAPDPGLPLLRLDVPFLFFRQDEVLGPFHDQIEGAFYFCHAVLLPDK